MSTSYEMTGNTDADPKNKTLIAHAPEWTEPANFTKLPAQKSKPVHLEGGKKYYIEAVHKENTGGANLSVGWIAPDGSAPVVIKGADLSPYLLARRGRSSTRSGSTKRVGRSVGKKSNQAGTTQGGLLPATVGASLATPAGAVKRRPYMHVFASHVSPERSNKMADVIRLALKCP